MVVLGLLDSMSSSTHDRDVGNLRTTFAAFNFGHTLRGSDRLRRGSTSQQPRDKIAFLV